MTPTAHIPSHKVSTAFWISFIVTILAALVAPRTLAFLPPALGLIFTGFILIINKKFLIPPKKEIILFTATIILAFASSLWAPDQGFAIERSTKILIIFLPGLLFLNFARHIKWPKNIPFLHILISLHLLTALFFIEEKISGHQILHALLDKEINSFKLNRPFTVFAIFSLFPLFLIQTATIDKIKKIILFLFVSGLSVFALAFTESQTAQLAFATVLFFLLLFPIKPRLPLKILMASIILVTLFLPFTIAPLKSSIPDKVLMGTPLRHASMIHRLEVWNHAADKALEKPIYGNGIEALRFLKSNEWMPHMRSDNVLHAHNIILQIWAEFGIIGILLGVAFLLYIFSRIKKTECLKTRRLYLTVFMSCLCVSLTGYGCWQSWQLGLFITMAAFAIAIGRNWQDRPS